MSNVRDLLLAHGLDRIADYIEAAAKPSVYLTPEGRSDEPCSRLGGRPNLPAEVDWPRWRSRSLPFVAQLDLAAIPRIHRFSLPPRGSLYFFYEGGREAWGFTPEDRGSSQIVYVPCSLPEHALRRFPDDIDDGMRFAAVRLAPGVPDTSLPDVEDHVLDQLTLSAEERQHYWGFFEAWRQQMPPTFHRIGGYPEPIQGDPRLEAQLVSPVDWDLLLQVDSDERAGMMWGDVGRLYFLIRKQDLALSKFENAWLVFQCS